MIHAAVYNLGHLIRQTIGAGTPTEAASRGRLLLIVVCSENMLAIVFLAAGGIGAEGEFDFLILAVSADPS